MEVGAVGADLWLIGAHLVATSWSFNLDHLGACLCQHQSGERPGQQAAEIKNADILKRTHDRLLLLSLGLSHGLATDRYRLQFTAAYLQGEFALKNLSACRERKLFQAYEIFRHVVLGDALIPKVVHQIVRFHCSGHRNADSFTESIIGDRKCRHAINVLVANRDSLDVRGIDVVAAADNQILEAPLDAQIAGFVKNSEISREKPAIPVEAAFRRLLVVEIAKHQRGTTAADLSDLAWSDLLVRVGRIEQPHLVGFAAAAAGRNNDVRGIGGMSILMGGILRHSVHILRLDALLKKSRGGRGRGPRTLHVKDGDLA